MSCSTTPIVEVHRPSGYSEGSDLSAFLTETAASTVDRKGMGFNSFHADEAGQSRTLRGYVNAWLKPIFWSYDTVAPNALNAL
jgi:hypothetical protein